MGVPVGRWPDPASLTFHLRRVLEQLRIDLVLDVGAHRGEYATLLRRDAGYTGDIISFEPAADAFEELQSQAAHDPRWRIEQVALGDEPGTGRLQHYHQSTLNSLRSPSRFGSDVWHLQSGHSEDVIVARLDELDLPLGPQSAPLLKCDTQGFDLQVLNGAQGILEHVVALQFEIPMIRLYEDAADFQSMLGWVEAMGFAVSGVFPVAHDEHLRLVELDCVAVRSGS